MIVFEWDEIKAESNLRKHRINFTDAINVFHDPDAIFEEDRFIDSEPRWRALGLVGGVELLVVIHTVK